MAGIASCIPVDTFWTHEKPRTCIDPLRMFLDIAIPNVATDVVLLAFPIPWIWKLVVSTSQKIALLAIFLIASLYSCLHPEPFQSWADISTASSSSPPCVWSQSFKRKTIWIIRVIFL